MLVVPRSSDRHPSCGLQQVPYPSPKVSASECAIRHGGHDSSAHTGRQSQRYTQSPHSQHQLAYSSPPSVFERLPMEIQGAIYSHLDYQSLIHLSTMNRYLYRNIDPQRMAHVPDKTSFIMRAAKDFPQHRPSEKGHEFRPGNFECYICFRVRAPDHFDAYQPQTAYLDPYGRVVQEREIDLRMDREVYLRRFCIECGIKEGLHAPFDCMTTKTGVDLWVCLCRRVLSKPNHLKCRDCGADCPLRPRKK